MTPRLNYLAETERAALERGLKTERESVRALYADNPLAHILRLAEGDPTANKRYTQAIVRWHGLGVLLFEDVYKLYDDFLIYDRIKPRLPVEQRNPMRLATPRDLYELVQPYQENTVSLPQSKTAARAEHSREMRAQTTIHYEGDEGLVVTPLTVEASKYWGRGTRWCTAAETSNYFASYNKDGPLFIVARSDGVKFQYHAHSRAVRDATDALTDAAALLQQSPFIRKSHAALVHLWASAPGAIGPLIAQTEDLCCEAARLNGRILETVIDKTDKICREALCRNDEALRYVPADRIDLFREALRRDKRNFEYLPHEVMAANPALCVEAVRRDALAIKHMPAALQDKHPSLCIEAVRRNKEALPFIANPTYEICQAAVERDGLAIKLVPNAIKEKHPGLLILAVRQNSNALDFIAAPGPEIYLEAIRKDGLALKRVGIQTMELCRAAVRQNGLALMYVKNQTEDLCYEAVCQTGEALKFVHRQTKGMALAAVKADHRNLCYVQNVTPDILDVAYRNVGQ